MDVRKPTKNSDILLKYCEAVCDAKIGENNNSFCEPNKDDIRKNSSNS
jgi:hypothetical protein